MKLLRIYYIEKLPACDMILLRGHVQHGHTDCMPAGNL